MATLSDTQFRTKNNASGMVLQFPAELGTDSLAHDGKSLEHFVVFYVNTMQNDRYFGSAGSVKGRTVSTESPVYEKVGGNAQANIVNTGIATTVNSSSTVTDVTNTVGLTDITQEDRNKVITALSVKTWKRTDIMIALPMPQIVGKSYNANWSTGATAGGLGGDLIVGGVYGKMDKAVQEFLNKSSLLRAKSGRVENPRTEAMFESVLPSGSTFDWTLFPRTPEESKAIWNIIQIFKWAMLPDVDKNEIFYDIPNTFDIEYWTNGERNDWISRPMTSFVRSLSVNYCPTGHWVALNLEKDLRGDNWPKGLPPVGVTISVDFGEITNLDKRRIDENANFEFGRNNGVGTL